MSPDYEQTLDFSPLSFVNLQHSTEGDRGPQEDSQEEQENKPHDDQSWLTIRRRCELCKTRKVRAGSCNILLRIPNSISIGQMRSWPTSLWLVQP
jgi:hypothetical protein